jgi:hemerythrin
MSPKKTRFQILLEPEQLAALRRIQERTSAAVASQIRKAVETWIAEHGDRADRKRARTRKRP